MSEKNKSLRMNDDIQKSEHNNPQPYVRIFDRSNVDYYTPDNALDRLLGIIPKNFVIWEPCSGQGHMVRFFEQHGYKVISSDISKGQNFLIYEPDEHYDIIITNPPYNLSDQIINRCYTLGKPWLLLMPFNVLQGKQRVLMFRYKGIQLFLLGERINYIIPEEQQSKRKKQKSVCPFWSIWIGHNIPGYKNNSINYLY